VADAAPLSRLHRAGAGFCRCSLMASVARAPRTIMPSSASKPAPTVAPADD
jgi:hypothetical protein